MNTDMYTLTLTRAQMGRIRTACTYLGNEFNRDLIEAEEENNKDRVEIARNSRDMWFGLRDLIVAQIKEQDELHSEEQ